LFPTRGAIIRGAAYCEALVYPALPYMHHVRAGRDRVAIKIKHLTGNSHPIATGIIGKIL
jgi:hypothetical protein